MAGARRCHLSVGGSVLGPLPSLSRASVGSVRLCPLNKVSLCFTFLT